MNRQAYDHYLACFNARDYDGVLAHYAEDFLLEFAGYRFTRKDPVRRFYAFLHAYLNEQITVTAYVADAQMVALEGVVRLEALRDLTPETLAAEGYGRLVPMTAGQVVEIPQYIHYHLHDGLIVKAGCALA